MAGSNSSLANLDADAVSAALKQAGGSRSLAARRLGIGRSTLYRKLAEMERAASAARAKALVAAGRGGGEADAGKPVSEQDQRVEVVPEVRAEEPPPAIPNLCGLSLILAAEERQEGLREHPYGEWPTLALGPRQCRFACTADDVPRDQHRFCGRPTRVGPRNLDASWCDAHLARVWGTGSMAERIAHHVTKDVRRFG